MVVARGIRTSLSLCRTVSLPALVSLFHSMGTLSGVHAIPQVIFLYANMHIKSFGGTENISEFEWEGGGGGLLYCFVLYIY